jgi:hypothetical protein
LENSNVKKVSEEHPVLYHYTTAIGLQGIVESQQLWATNIAFLNDAEEHVGFFDRRLPAILTEPIRESLSELDKSERGRTAIQAEGGNEAAGLKLRDSLVKLLRSHTLSFQEPYITAFCSPIAHPTENDGLLSQWRGYGTDGGYAIVFDSARLEELLQAEVDKYLYQFMTWGDADYYSDQDAVLKSSHLETFELEKTLKSAIREFILSQSPKALEPLLEPITTLSCRHKHGGFREESEVRMIAVPANDDVWNEAKRRNIEIQRKSVHFTNKGGVLVPYIKLFGNDGESANRKLPIVRVIIGPHLERDKRKKAVELLLKQNGIDAPVLVSEIPYLGR